MTQILLVKFTENKSLINSLITCHRELLPKVQAHQRVRRLFRTNSSPPTPCLFPDSEGLHCLGVWPEKPSPKARLMHLCCHYLQRLWNHFWIFKRVKSAWIWGSSWPIVSWNPQRQGFEDRGEKAQLARVPGPASQLWVSSEPQLLSLSPARLWLILL